MLLLLVDQSTWSQQRTDLNREPLVRARCATSHPHDIFVSVRLSDPTSTADMSVVRGRASVGYTLNQYCAMYSGNVTFRPKLHTAFLRNGSDLVSTAGEN